MANIIHDNIFLLTIMFIPNELYTFGFHCIYTSFPLVNAAVYSQIYSICMLFEAGMGYTSSCKKYSDGACPVVRRDAPAG